MYAETVKLFLDAPYLDELMRLRDELKAGLAGVPPEGSTEEIDVAALAERIKQLRATNTVDAVPQRTAKKAVAATEAVTTTIKRREGDWAIRVDGEEERKAGRG